VCPYPETFTARDIQKLENIPQHLPAVDDPLWHLRSNKVAMAFVALGRMKWANRCNDCGMVWHFYCDVGGSKHGLQGRQRNSCNMKFCPECAERMAKEALARREDMFTLLKMTRERLVYLEAEFLVPYKLTEENIPYIRAWAASTYTRLSGQLNDYLMNLMLAKKAGYGPYWTYAPAIRNGHLIFRALMVMGRDLILSHDWKKVWPDAVKADVQFSHTPHIDYFFGLLMKPVIPHSPEHRALQEIIFERFRRLRSENISDRLGQPPADDHAISTEEETLMVDNAPDSEEQIAPKPPKAHIHCKICGMLCSPRLESPYLQPTKIES
jgi:hypothetical protein